MLKSFHLCIDLHCKPVATAAHLEHLQRSICMQHADNTYWKQDANEVIIQEFDGLQGFLYHIDFGFKQKMKIPVLIRKSDIHIFYTLSGTRGIQLLDLGENKIMDIRPGRARYVYLPVSNYMLLIPKGYTQLFGLYFRGNLFRDGNDVNFWFLKQLIQAYRQKASEAVFSQDFRIGPRTQAHIQYLCSRLHRGDLHNEAFILSTLCQLLQLSREKVLDEYDQSGLTAIHAKQAFLLIEQSVQLHGSDFSIQDLAPQLGVSVSYLCRIFREHYTITAQQHKDQLLLKRIKEELNQGKLIYTLAIELGFSSIASFCRYFKKHTQQRPSDYIASRED